jgi:hypothetical protein
VAMEVEAAQDDSEWELCGGICRIYSKRLFGIVEKFLLIRLQFPLVVGSSCSGYQSFGLAR